MKLLLYPFSSIVEQLAEAIARDRGSAVFIDAGAQKQGESEMHRLARIMGASEAVL